MSSFPNFKLSPAAHYCDEITVGLAHQDNFILLDITRKSPMANQPQVFFNYTLQVATGAVESARRGKVWMLDYGYHQEELGIPEFIPSLLCQPELDGRRPGAIYYLRIPKTLVERYHPLDAAKVAINALRWFAPAASAVIRGMAVCSEVNSSNAGRMAR